MKTDNDKIWKSDTSPRRCEKGLLCAIVTARPTQHGFGRKSGVRSTGSTLGRESRNFTSIADNPVASVSF